MNVPLSETGPSSSFSSSSSKVGSIAVIGGSGFYDFLPNGIPRSVRTPYGQVEFQVFTLKNHKIIFLPRHGSKHTVPPHLVNYRANIYALFMEGVTHVFATNAVGSCVSHIAPGDFVVPDQLIDFTKNRPSTFFEGDTTSPSIPQSFRKVQHIDVTFPYHGMSRNSLIHALRSQSLRFHDRGTYVVTEGPRFETAAEVRMFAQLGGHLLGMTSAPEVFLARELGMDYATLCLVTNYGAGMQNQVSHREVIELFNQKIGTIKDIVQQAILLLLE